MESILIYDMGRLKWVDSKPVFIKPFSSTISMHFFTITSVYLHVTHCSQPDRSLIISWLFSFVMPQSASHSFFATFSMYVISTLIHSYTERTECSEYFQFGEGHTTIVGIDFLEDFRLQFSPCQILADSRSGATSHGRFLPHT